MTSLKKLLLTLAVLGTSVAVQAESTNFAGLSYGQTTNSISKSKSLNDNLSQPYANGIIHKDHTFGLRIGQVYEAGRYYATYDNVSGSHHANKQRQGNLLGSYDLFMPVGKGTKLFGGASAGLTKIAQKSSSTSRDTNIGYTVGAQAGILRYVSKTTSVELSYRYLRTNASTELNEQGGGKQGSMKVNGSAQIYLAANYAF